MNLIRPHAFFLVAATKMPLQVPITMLETKVPFGAAFRLDYILVSYPQEIVGDPLRTASPQLEFTLLNTRGVAHNNDPIPFPAVTTPGGGIGSPSLPSAAPLRAAQGFRIEFPPGAFITLRITGMDAGPLPATISVTYLGQKGWGRR